VFEVCPIKISHHGQLMRPGQRVRVARQITIGIQRLLQIIQLLLVIDQPIPGRQVDAGDDRPPAPILVGLASDVQIDANNPVRWFGARSASSSLSVSER